MKYDDIYENYLVFNPFYGTISGTEIFQTVLLLNNPIGAIFLSSCKSVKILREKEIPR